MKIVRTDRENCTICINRSAEAGEGGLMKFLDQHVLMLQRTDVTSVSRDTDVMCDAV